MYYSNLCDFEESLKFVEPSQYLLNISFNINTLNCLASYCFCLTVTHPPTHTHTHTHTHTYKSRCFLLTGIFTTYWVLFKWNNCMKKVYSDHCCYSYCSYYWYDSHYYNLCSSESLLHCFISVCKMLSAFNAFYSCVPVLRWYKPFTVIGFKCTNNEHGVVNKN